MRFRIFFVSLSDVSFGLQKWGDPVNPVATRLSPEELQEVEAACIGWRRRRWRIAGSAHSKPTSKRAGIHYFAHRAQRLRGKVTPHLCTAFEKLGNS